MCDHHSNRKFLQDGAETIVPQQSAALESILRVRLKTFQKFESNPWQRMNQTRPLMFPYAEAEAHVHDGRLQW